jgi:hypothetical protein
MPSVIDHETMTVNELPPIWSPIQWDLTEDEHNHELEQQATASLLWMMDAPEAILRLLLGETDIERLYDAPKGYDPDQQGEWLPDVLTFGPKREIKLEEVERAPNELSILYNVSGLGRWTITIEPERVIIERV